MRAALVTSCWEGKEGDPESALLRSLASGLAERGCDMEIYTTTSSAPAVAGCGGLVWNRYHPRGTSGEAGLVIHRFPAARAGNPLHVLGRRPPGEWWERAARVGGFSEYCRRALGEAGGMLCGGWHRHELWDDGPARWSRKEGTLILCGRAIEEIELRLQAPLEQVVRIGVEGGRQEVFFSAGEEKRVRVGISPRDSLLVRVRPGKIFRPAADRRKLGVALREVLFRDSCGSWRVDLAHDTENLPEGDWESIPPRLAEELSPCAGWEERRWRREIGPLPAGLRGALTGRAGDFQVIIAARARHYTAKVALEAAEEMAVPLVLVPLLPPREAAADLPFFLHLASRARAVMDPDPSWRGFMRDMGKPFFHLPAPALFAAGEDTAAQRREAEALRRRLGWRQGLSEAFLLVSAEGSQQGERRVREILRALRERGVGVRVAVTGRGAEIRARPREPLPEGLEVLELSTGSAHARRLLACLCDVYVQGGRANDWGEKICLAQAQGGETVAWEGCPVAASLRDLMGTGHLCGEAEEFARVIVRLVEEGGGVAGVSGEDAGAAAREKMRDLRERTLGELLAWLDEVREGIPGLH